uniref:DUF481 domain-containing protein n=1 Tax=candidate division WOR-3 bacterium TaxID=2052148 RepID=A0A7V0Z6P4_UNCW3
MLFNINGKVKKILCIRYVTIILITASALFAQTPDTLTEKEAPKVFIDYELIDMDFIKNEIPYVNYVIERKDADIYIMITTQTTAGEGKEYNIFFIGQGKFSGMCDTLKYYALKSDSDDIIRREITKKIKIGLVRYLAKTHIAEKLLITLPEKKIILKPKDPWHNWVFSIDLYGYFSGQQKYNFNNINTTFSANKILEDWKILNDLSYYYTKNIYKINDSSIINESKSYSGSTNLVIGLGNHFSAGYYLSFYSSTYENILISSGFSPAIEYNIYPYKESSTRKLTFFYDLGYVYFEYYDTTIFNKLQEKLFKETGSIETNIIQRWGSINLKLTGSHYFHNFKKNRLTLHSDISLPIVKGLSFKVFSYVSMIHDQLSLPKKELTEEEIILQKRILATQYSYYLSIGFSYTFGSIYSNIVNPRF